MPPDALPQNQQLTPTGMHKETRSVFTNGRQPFAILDAAKKSQQWTGCCDSEDLPLFQQPKVP